MVVEGGGGLGFTTINFPTAWVADRAIQNLFGCGISHYNRPKCSPVSGLHVKSI